MSNSSLGVVDSMIGDRMSTVCFGKVLKKILYTFALRSTISTIRNLKKNYNTSVHVVLGCEAPRC